MDLYTFLNRYPNVQKRRVLIPVLKAIFVLHSNNIIHYDIKFENFVVDCKFTRIRLIDFECCQNWDEPKKKLGTEGYMAPEILLYNRILDYSPGKQDIWSFGYMYYLWENPDIEIIKRKSKKEYQLLTQEVTNHYILKHCLCMNPDDRLDIKNLIRECI